MSELCFTFSSTMLLLFECHADIPSFHSMAQSIKIMFAIAIFITHALQGYVPVEIIWHTYLDQKIQKRKIFWEYVCRTIITLATCKFINFRVFFQCTV